MLNIYNVLRPLYSNLDQPLKDRYGIHSEKMFRGILFHWLMMCEQWPFRVAIGVRQLMDDAQQPGGIEGVYKHTDIQVRHTLVCVRMSTDSIVVRVSAG